MQQDPTKHVQSEVVRAVELRLEQFLARKIAMAPRDVQPVVKEIRSLSLRGGKRLRALIVHAGFKAIDTGFSENQEKQTENNAKKSAIIELATAFELVQSYLLIHDDWMDEDEIRRGGPTVHTALQSISVSKHQANSLAILAGDIAAAYSLECLTSAFHSHSAVEQALVQFAQMLEDVTYGQALDILADKDVSKVAELKTGSYTIKAPLRLGALLASSNQNSIPDEVDSLLVQLARPLGRAFQLRDDWIGIVGKPENTGKPMGTDLLRGRQNSLIDQAQKSMTVTSFAPVAAVLESAKSNPQTPISAEQLRHAVDILSSSEMERWHRKVLTGEETQVYEIIENISKVASGDLRPLKTLVERLIFRDV